MAKAKSKKSSKSKKSNKKSDSNFANIGQYLVAKNKKTKYIKFEAAPKADKEVKALVKNIIKALGTDVVYVNLFDDDFRDKYEIPEFVKGRISVNLDANEADDDSEDDEDEESDDDDDSEDDEDEDDDSEDDDEDDDDDSDF